MNIINLFTKIRRNKLDRFFIVILCLSGRLPASESFNNNSNRFAFDNPYLKHDYSAHDHYSQKGIYVPVITASGITIQDRSGVGPSAIPTDADVLLSIKNISQYPELTRILPKNPAYDYVRSWIEKHKSLIEQTIQAVLENFGTPASRKKIKEELLPQWKAAGQESIFRWKVPFKESNNNNVPPEYVNNKGTVIELTVVNFAELLGAYHRAIYFYKKQLRLDPPAFWEWNIEQADIDTVKRVRGDEFKTHSTTSNVIGYWLFNEAKRRWLAENPGKRFPVTIPDVYLYELEPGAGLYDNNAIAVLEYPAGLQPIETNPQAVVDAAQVLRYLVGIGGAWQLTEKNNLQVTPDGKVVIMNLAQPAETDHAISPYTFQAAANAAINMVYKLFDDVKRKEPWKDVDVNAEEIQKTVAIQEYKNIYADYGMNIPIKKILRITLGTHGGLWMSSIKLLMP